jgi:Ca2+-binding RTX toxin-like protein
LVTDDKNGDDIIGGLQGNDEIQGEQGNDVLMVDIVIHQAVLKL